MKTLDSVKRWLSPPLHIFCGYTHEDKALFGQLKKALAVLIRQKQITVWHYGELVPGIDWESEIEQQLHTADIILLLLSPSFMDSDYCWNKELQWAITRHATGEACVIPILLKPTLGWETTILGTLQALPTEGKPITTWSRRDEALADVVLGLHMTIQQMKQDGYSPTKEYQIISRMLSFHPQKDPDMTEVQNAICQAEQWVEAVSSTGRLQQITDSPFQKEWLFTDHQYTCRIMVCWYEEGLLPSAPMDFSWPSVLLFLTSTHLALLDRLLETKQLPYHTSPWFLHLRSLT